MEQYLQQLESAIVAASGGDSQSSQQLDIERTQRSDGLAEACIELLLRRGWGSNIADNGGSKVVARYDSVAFYALTTLQRSPILSCTSNTNFTSLRTQLKSLILSTITNSINLQSMPNFVITKVAVLLALLIREEYPTEWNTPLNDVLVALNLSSSIINNGGSITIEKMASMGMYLSVLDAISDEIVYPSVADEGGNVSNNNSRERIRREQVKDTLRGFAITTESGNTQPVPLENSDTANIVGWLLDVVVTITTTVQTQESEMLLTLAVRALATLKRYLSWIDIRLATNPNLIQMLLKGLGGASSCSTSGDDEEEPTQRTMLSVECANCLSEVIDRGMDEQKKLDLLTQLDIFGTLFQLSQIQANGSSNGTVVTSGGKLDLINIDGTQVEAVSSAAELINTAGLALIQGWEIDPTSQTTNTQMKQCFELVLACLAYDSIDVSGAVIDLMTRLLQSLEKKEQHWTTLFSDASICNKILPRILLILHLRMKYPNDFEYDYEDEDEAEEELYRANLRKLYQRIVHLRHDIALQFIGQCLSSIPQPLSSSPTPDIEVGLRLVYHYGEGRRPTGAKTALKDSGFKEIVMAVHRSDVASHPHREVLLLYYDISVRYAAILKECPELLTLFLGSLSGNRGLQHTHARVRCRCCYLLLRLIKSVGAKAMKPHVEAIVEGIQTLLFPPPGAQTNIDIPANEALYLFEATGLLLGTTGLDSDIQVRCATAVLTPHIQSIGAILQNPEITRDVETYGEQLSLSISAIAQLSKGWQKHPPPGVQEVLVAAVDVCRKVLLALPSSPLIRSWSAVLIQRMIFCLGEGVLPLMPTFFPPLLLHCTLEEDILDISQLMNQLCIKFKEKAVAAIDLALLPFIQKVFAIQTGNITEQLSVRKQAFATLQHIALHNASPVLYSQTNVSSLGDILQLMYDGASSVPDPVMNKTCVQFFCELISQWGGSGIIQAPPNVVNAFFDFAYSVFVPGMTVRILDNTFNAKDALYCRVLAEFSRSLWLLKQSCRGNVEFQSRFIEIVLNGGGGERKLGSQKIALGFQNAACAKDIELTLKEWKVEQQ